MRLLETRCSNTERSVNLELKTPLQTGVIRTGNEHRPLSANQNKQETPKIKIKIKTEWTKIYTCKQPTIEKKQITKSTTLNRSG